MPINHELKTLFVHIPKCGGTSVGKMLDMSRGENLYTLSKSNSPVFSTLDVSKFTPEELVELKSKNLQHCTFRELKKLLPENVFSTYEYFRFTIIRNPYTRIISEYFYLMDLSKKKMAFKNFHIEFPSPSDFIMRELALPRLERIKKYDGHLETQCDYLIDTTNEDIYPKKKMKIYRFEVDMDRCFNTIKARSKSNIEIAHERKGNYEKDYAKYYNEESQDAVYEFYKNDFDYLGYFDYKKILEV